MQFSIFTHQLDESRGALSNIFHNAISDYLHERYELLPLLRYRGNAELLEPAWLRERMAEEVRRLAGVYMNLRSDEATADQVE